MKSKTRSSISLPSKDLDLVESLKARLRLRSNVEVVRRGLLLLQKRTERELLRAGFRQAAAATRDSVRIEIDELDHLAGERLD